MVKFNELVIKAIASAHDPQKVRTKNVEEAAQNVILMIIIMCRTMSCDYVITILYVQMIDDVMIIQKGLLVAHNLSTSGVSGSKPSGQPHILPFDLNTSPIPATSPQSNSSESPRKLLT